MKQSSGVRMPRFSHSALDLDKVLWVFWVVAQFGKEASQARDYGVAKNATLRAARPDPFGFAQGRLFAAQRALAQDGRQTAPLPFLAGHDSAFEFRLQLYFAHSRGIHP